jgi:hypothetical protein
MTSLDEFVAEIAEQCWRQDTPKTVKRIGKKLVKSGVAVDQVTELLRDFYTAVKSEYGD